jgi:4-amino-4-deoxy-L-arabinose transferase-like glycosyltransferase
MKAHAPTIDRVARGVAIVASAWFAFAAAWGMFGIPGGGHIGSGSAANVMAAEQMIRWKIMYPAWGWYNGDPPALGNYYCHHPFGLYYVSAALGWVFGHHDVLVHLPAVLMSAAIPPLLYGIGKERWGAPLGAVAAAGYSVVPIAVGFSNFWNLETISIFGSLLFFLGHSRHMTTRRTRYLVASLIGLATACSGDWVGYLLVAPTLGWAFLRAFVLPLRLTPRFRLEPYTRWWALSVTVAVASLVWWIWLFHHVNQIADWLNSGASRGGAHTDDFRASLRATLDARKSWIEFSFTPLAIKIGKVAAPVCLVRWFVTRRDEETYSLGILFGASLQYVGFKEGADVHIFWPHYFAAYFALALAQLAGAIAAALGWLVGRVNRSRAPAVAAIAGLALGLIPVAAMAHDGVSSLWVWRRTGGRYNDRGSPIESGIDELYVLKNVIRPRIARETRIDHYPSVGWGWEQLWTNEGEANAEATPSAGVASAPRPFWIGRGSRMSGDEERRIAGAAHVRIYGDIWVVDEREGAGPVDAISLNEHEPSLVQWLLVDGTEPARSIGKSPDPWATWEWRTHLGQPAALPAGEPTTLDELRISHNVAISQGDDTAAGRLLQRIKGQLDLGAATSFGQGVRLLGTRVTRGAQPKVESWFECTSPMGDASFNVRSSVEARAPFSLIDPDPIDREMAYPPPISTKLWRPRFLYMTYAVLNHRIGRERYAGAWQSRDGSPAPRRADGKPDTTLAVIP